MSVQIVLGRSRFRRRAAMVRSVLTGTDGQGRPNFTYLTDTLRKSQLVQDEFARYRSGATFLPEVHTLAALLTDLHRRFGDGRAPWPDAAVVMQCRSTRLASPAAWPWLGSLDDNWTTAADLARLFQSWQEADRPTLAPIATDPRPTELRAYFAAVDATLANNPDYVCVADLLTALIRTLEALPYDNERTPLGGWLHQPHAVVIDDVLHPSRLRTRALIALATAWSTLGKHVVFGLESGRDLGGAEAGSFFEYDRLDDPESAFSLRPFEATLQFRRALFHGIIDRGRGAVVHVAGPTGGLHDAVAPDDDLEPADLADRLWCRTPLPPPGPTPWLEVASWPDRSAEITAIALALRASLLAGERAQDHWVAIAGLPTYLPELARVFDELGVPWSTAAGLPLTARPCARRLLALARWERRNWPLDEVMEALLAASAWRDRTPQLQALWRAAREHGITSARGLHSVDSAVEGGEGVAADVRSFTEAVEGLDGVLDAPEWARRLIGAAVLLGIDENAGDDAVLALAVVGDVARAAAALGGAREGRALADALEAALGDTLVRPAGASGPGGGGVEVVGLRDLRGIDPRWLWIGGLTAGEFPPAPSDDYLLGRDSRRALGLPDAADEARYIFASALRNAADHARRGGPLLAPRKHPTRNFLNSREWASQWPPNAAFPARSVTGAVLGGRRRTWLWNAEKSAPAPVRGSPSAGIGGPPRLTLSWPATVAGKTVARSSLLLDLVGLWPVPSESPLRVYRGTPEHAPVGARGVDTALGERFAAGERVPPPGSGEATGLIGRGRMLRARRIPEPGVYDGMLTSPVPTRPRLGATELEGYLKCPMTRLFRRVLALTAEEGYDRDVPHRAWGDLVHLVLHQFVRDLLRDGVGRIRPEHLPALSARLEALARRLATQPRADGTAPASPLLRLSPALAAHRVASLVGGLVDDDAPGVLHAWLQFEANDPVEHHFDAVERRLAPDALTVGGMPIDGQIDRVDRLPDGRPFVLDYKTGLPPSARDVLAGLRVQGLLYLDAASGEGATGIAAYMQVGKPGEVRRDGWTGAPDALAALKLRKSAPLDDAFRARIDGYLAESVARLKAGALHTTLATAAEAGCDYCSFKYACKVDHARNARFAEALPARPDAARYQAPLSEAEES